MQSVSSRIWTRVAVSISYDDNHYTTLSNKGIMFYEFDRGRYTTEARKALHENHRTKS